MELYRSCLVLHTLSGQKSLSSVRDLRQKRGRCAETLPSTKKTDQSIENSHHPRKLLLDVCTLFLLVAWNVPPKYSFFAAAIGLKDGMAR